MENQKNKTCSRCEQTKPIDCFNQRQAKCKPCQKQYKDEWDKANKEHNQEYHASEKGKAIQAKYWTKISPGVYQVLNKQTGKRYIGESEIPNKRRKDHWSYLRGGYHDNPNLQKAYDKYGEDAFEFEMIEHCEPSQLKQRETYWIKKHKDKCYNLRKV